MKKLLKITAYGFFTFLACNAAAQSNTGPEAKPLDAVNTLKSTGKNATISDIKETLKPITLPLQKVEDPKVAAPSKPIPAEQKPVEMSPNLYKKVEPANIDRPKPTTLTGLKSTDPIQLPVQPAQPKKE